jgi:hypothetical protein
MAEMLSRAARIKVFIGVLLGVAVSRQVADWLTNAALPRTVMPVRGLDLKCRCPSESML